MSRTLDIKNKRFGRLVAIEPVGRNEKHLVQWRCVCDCGEEIVVTATRLNCGNKKSCGCLAKETARKTIYLRTNSSTFEEYFNANVERGSGVECWLWTGNKDKDGYGVSWFRKNKRRAHRESYERYVGPIPDGMLVCHHCDTPQCVNPEHLFLGTCKENLRDALRKGRFAVGEKNGRSKLTREQVEEVLASSENGQQLATKFGVQRQTINRIRRGEGWLNV